MLRCAPACDTPHTAKASYDKLLANDDKGGAAVTRHPDQHANQAARFAAAEDIVISIKCLSNFCWVGSCISHFCMQQRRKDAAAKAEDLAEQQRLRLLEKERLAEANRLLVRVSSQIQPAHVRSC